MRKILQDTTNVKKGKIIKNRKSDKESVLEYIKEVHNTTIDYNLKYDLSKCIQIIEGKENQEIIDLKEALEDVMQENEELLAEKTRLYLELNNKHTDEYNENKVEALQVVKNEKSVYEEKEEGCTITVQEVTQSNEGNEEVSNTLEVQEATQSDEDSSTMQEESTQSIHGEKEDKLTVQEQNTNQRKCNLSTQNNNNTESQRLEHEVEENTQK